MVGIDLHSLLLLLVIRNGILNRGWNGIGIIHFLYGTRRGYRQRLLEHFLWILLRRRLLRRLKGIPLLSHVTCGLHTPIAVTCHVRKITNCVINIVSDTHI